MALGSADHPAREAAGRIPVVAVVDAWNFRSQVRAAFGQPRHATVEGIIGAFRPYGFEVVEVCFALGVEPATGSATRARPVSADLAKALRRNIETKLRWEADPRARVLAGRLVEVADDKGGQAQPAEKMVDVLCAVEICRLAVRIRDGGMAARGIICVSEDMDLIPAHRFAEEMGVPCWVAARDTVHRRWVDHRWLILDDGSLSTATSRYTGQPGHTLRRAVAEASLKPGLWFTMSVRFVDRRLGKVSLVSEDGLLCHLPLDELPDGVAPGHRLNVSPTGIDLGRERRDFPALRVSIRASTVRENQETAVVVRWVNPTTIDARMGNRTQRINVPAGHLLPGMRILVQVGRKGEPRYIGPLEARPQVPSGWCASTTMTARVADSGSGSRGVPFTSDAVIESNGQSVVLLHETRWATPGDRYPVFLADTGTGGELPRVMSLGSTLSTSRRHVRN